MNTDVKPHGQQGRNDPTAATEKASEVLRLVAAGKCKQAVELAKDEHKRLHTPESEQLLVDAYLSRIQQFQEKGAVEDARTLLNLVRERFPAHRGRLAPLEMQSAAISGQVDVLVAPLARPDTPDEQRLAIEEAIRRQLTDLSALASARTLPEQHPLRTAATALWEAFQAVTAGPVTDEQIALPAVSHRSPLAGWKMLIRGLAAFYREEDEACRRALEAIPDDSPLRRLSSILMALMAGKPAGAGIPGAIQARIGGDDRPLRRAMEEFDREIQRSSLGSVKRAIRAVVQSCSASHPELYERLRQHISVRCVINEFPLEEVVRAMGTSLKDAYFWRLLALGWQKRGESVMTAMAWERFLRHGIHEKLLNPGSLEEAAIYLHSAKLLGRLPAEDLRKSRIFLSRTPLLKSFYKNQPPEVAGLAPIHDGDVLDKSLDPGWLFARAAEIRPDMEVFQQWWDWMQKADAPEREREAMAKTWHASRPGDPQPLVVLSALAEDRKALKLALNYLGEAEAIDAMNPHVRKARLRLTLATTWRHLKDRKPHLVEKNLAELEALPAMKEGDREAVLFALRIAWHVLRKEKEQASKMYEAVVERIGAVAGQVLVQSVANQSRLLGLPDWPGAGVAGPPPEPRAVAEAEARGIRLSLDLGVKTWRPASWDSIVTQVLRQKPCPLAQADLLAIGRAAAFRQDFEQAYLASAAGLANASGSAVARFLLIRAESFKYLSYDRSSQCLRAAMTLAQQAHDPELMNEVSAASGRIGPVRCYMTGGGVLSSELLADVLKSERGAGSYPRRPDDAEKHVVVFDSLDSGFSGSEEGEYDEDYDDDEDDEYDYEDENTPGLFDLPKGGPKLPKKMPPEALPLIAELFEKFGRMPTPQELMNQAPELAMKLVGLITGMNPDNPVLDDLLDEMQRNLLPGGFGHGGNKRRKRKRR